MSSLQGYDFIRYNGFTFRGPRVSSHLQVRAVRDRANRTVKAWEYVLTVEAFLTGDADVTSDQTAAESALVPSVTTNPYQQAGGTTGISRLDDVMDKARTSLMQDGGALYYTNQGFGASFQVNTGNTGYRDIAWGPKTDMIRFEPVGVQQVWHVVWSCTFTLPSCSGLGLGQILAFNYSVGYSINQSGLTQRTVAGYIEIVQYRDTIDNRNVTKTPDTYRKDKLAVSVPLGFRRVHQDYHISEDHATETFVVVDAEEPGNNALPDGVVTGQMSHTVTVARGDWSAFHNTISGSVEVAKGRSVALAMEKVLLIIRERVVHAKTAPGVMAVLLTQLSITDHLFQPRIDFSVNYIARIKPIALKMWMRKNGLFKPLTTTSFQTWGQSMDNAKVWDAHGIAQMIDNPAGDLVFNPCSTATPDLKNITSIVPNPKQLGQQGSLSNDCAPVYMQWGSRIEFQDDAGQIVHEPLFTGTSTSPDNGISGMPINSDQRDSPVTIPSPGQSTSLNSGYKAFTQSVRPNRTLYLRFVGGAVRVGKPADPPYILGINGISSSAFSKMDGGKVQHTQSGSVGGCQIYATAWDVKYRVLDAPPGLADQLKPSDLRWSDPDGLVQNPQQDGI